MLFHCSWAYLDIKTNSSHNDIDQAYTAGLAEGILTSDLIKMHWYNTEMDRYCTKPLTGYCQRLQDYLDVNAAWMLDQIAAKAQTDPYWHQVREVCKLNEAEKAKSCNI